MSSSNAGSPFHQSTTSTSEYNDFVEGTSIPCGTYKLNFGSNFLSNNSSDSKQQQYHIIKFDIKPPNSRGNSYINFDSNDSIKLTIPTDEPESNAIYKGTVSSVKNGKECLLLFDGENLRIEKVATTMVAKHVRSDRGEEDEEMKPQLPEPLITTTTTITKQPSKPIIDEIDDGGESSSNEEEQMLLEEIASSTQPPSNPELPILLEETQTQKTLTLPTYTPAHLHPSPPRTHSSATLHPSPAISIPTPSSKNSSLMEDLAMSDSSESSSSSGSDSSESEGEEDVPMKAIPEVTVSKPEPMDFTMNEEKRLSPAFEPFNKAPPSSNNDIRNMITGGGFDLLSSDLQLSESSSDEDE